MNDRGIVGVEMWQWGFNDGSRPMALPVELPRKAGSWAFDALIDISTMGCKYIRYSRLNRVSEITIGHLVPTELYASRDLCLSFP